MLALDVPELDLDALFSAHARTLLRVAARIAGHGPHVEDIVQEAFTIAARRAHEVNVESPRGWLCGICANVARHHLRSGARRARLVEACLNEARKRADGRARAWRVRAAVADLPEDQRIAVVLNVFEEIPCAQIAAGLDVSVKTVESRVRLAREKIALAVEDLR